MEQSINNIILENRKKLSVSGVEEVDSFDENSAVLYTSGGCLEIKGRNIHMTKLDLDSTEVILDGEFDSMAYRNENEQKEKKSFLSGFFG